MCANNYLGLSSHPEVIQAAKDALDSHGYGMSSVRFICGTQDIHKELEAKIAKFYGTEDTILYAAAFDANDGEIENEGLEGDSIAQNGGGDRPEVASTAGGDGGGGDVDGATLEVSGESEAKKARPDNAEDES